MAKQRTLIEGFWDRANKVMEGKSEKIGISRGAIQYAIDGLTRRAGGYQWTRL